MIKKLLFLAITSLMTVNINGQSDNSSSNSIRQLDIGLGGLHYQIRDDIIAPLRWDGIGPVMDFSYSIINDKARHDFELRLPAAFTSNRYGHKAKALEINLNYDYLRKITGNNSSGQLHLGGLIRWNHNLQYYENWDDSHFYWLNVYEMGPKARWSNTFGNDHHLAVNLNFILLALASRPPELRYYDQLKLDEIYSKPHENMKLTSIHKYISAGLRGQYFYRLNSKINIGVSYFLNYKTYSEPSRISLLSNTLQLQFLLIMGNKQKE